MRGFDKVAVTALGSLLLIAAVLVIAGWPTGDPPDPAPDLVDIGERVSLPDPAGKLALREGEDRRLVEDSCTSCHSLAPIIRHDGFAEDVWEAEVKKMIESYGAPIDEDAARRITAYLQRHYSGEPRPAAGTSNAPGTSGG